MAKKEKEEKTTTVDGRIQQLKDALTKQFGKEIELFADENRQVEAVPTGIYSLDTILGGGFAKGRIIEAYGAEGSGKTTISLYTAAQVQKAGGVVAYIDVEHAINTKYANQIGVNTTNKTGDNWLLIQPDNAEQALGAIEGAIGLADLIVLDSVAALSPEAEQDGEIGDSNMGVMARLMGQSMRRITAKLSKSGTTLLLLNQTRQKLGIVYGSNVTTPGGNAIKFFASQRLEISKAGTLKETVKGKEKVIGQDIRVKVIKNKITEPYQETTFSLFYGRGVDIMADIINLAISKGFIQASGSWYNMGDIKLGQGINNVAAKFAEDQELLTKLLDELNAKD